jgi:hypothetical protein
MRQYLLDEIPAGPMTAIKAYLKERTLPSTLDEIFWLELPEDLLSPLQREHQACGPHYLAIEVGKGFIKFEGLVRSQKKFRCDCIQYATAPQEAFLLEFAHALIRDLQLTT